MTTPLNQRPVDSPSLHKSAGAAGYEVNLAARWLGSSVVAASDESFGDKENLLNSRPVAFEPGHYSHRGEIVDGWETRRRREPGHDWVIIRLGAPGQITSINVDTSSFTGNFPESCRIEACGQEGYPSPAELLDPQCEWIEIVPRTPLAGDSRNLFPVSNTHRFTHVRLSIYPDGGVARLQVFGQVIPDPRLLDGLTFDLASEQYGGIIAASSDEFYTPAHVLIRPDQPQTMGEGWETRRRRGPGNDFVVLQLAFAGEIHQLHIDTSHFVYNATAAIAVYGSNGGTAPALDSPAWIPLLGRTRLQPDTYHIFSSAHRVLADTIRLDAFPDGGIARVHIIGSIAAEARRKAGYRWFNALPAGQAIQCLAAAGIPLALATDLVQHRPLEGPTSMRELATMLEGPNHR